MSSEGARGRVSDESGQPVTETPAAEVLWEKCVRGLLLGLALGDAIGTARGKLPSDGVLRVGVSTQLAAFTVEGLIRAMVRGHHKGITDPAGVVWHAYNRWAVMQGLGSPSMDREWAPYAQGEWPDGWLAHVPALSQRRGSAPATVKAVTGGVRGTVDAPVTDSAGAHALTRLLPAAAMARVWDRDGLVGQVEEMAALTHGNSDAHWAASTGVLWAAGCLSGADLVDALLATGEVEMGTWIGYARDMSNDRPRNADFLSRVATDASARSALSGAVYVTHSFPNPADALDAVSFAAASPHGRSAAVVAAAILGATHGVDVWPIDAVSRLEVAWPLDVLARDLVAQLTDNPGGSEFTAAKDPHWWGRYPGW